MTLNLILFSWRLPFVSPMTAVFFFFVGLNIWFQIVYDRVTDRSRGFAFVTMGSVQEAKEAIRMFDGSVSANSLYFLSKSYIPSLFL